MKGALPYRLSPDGAPVCVEWMWTDGARYTEPFFEQTIARLRRTSSANRDAKRLRTPLAALMNCEGGLPLRGLIFHVSRCGSTLLARMLAAVPRNNVASEPQIIDDILRLDSRLPAITSDEKIALLRGAVAALGQPAAGADRLFVKLDCWHLFDLPLIRRAFPDVPLVFVYRDPLEVLVSLMRMPSFTLVRPTVRTEYLGLTESERNGLSPEEHAAAILGAFFRTAQKYRDLVVPVPYEALPGAALTAFEPATASDREQMLAAATADAKNPGQLFIPDATTKRRSASPKILAAAAKWAEPAYREWLELLARDER